MTADIINPYGNTSKGKTLLDLNDVAVALNELSRIRKRPDGYSLEVVKAVRAAILNDTEHPLKTCVLNIIKFGSEKESQPKKKPKKAELLQAALMDYRSELENSIKDHKSQFAQDVKENQGYLNSRTIDNRGGCSARQEVDISSIPSNAVLFG